MDDTLKENIMLLILKFYALFFLSFIENINTWKKFSKNKSKKRKLLAVVLTGS